MPDWLDGLEDDELKGNESLANFEDVGALAKSYLETKSMVGKGLFVPTENANDEQRAAFYDKVLEQAPSLMMRPNMENDDARKAFFKSLGVPEDSSKYEEVKVDDIGFDEDRDTAIRKAAHEAGLTPAQYKSVVTGMLEFDKGGLGEREKVNMEQMRELKLEWGMAFDDKKAIANKVRDTFLDFIPEAQMDARTIKALNMIGAQLIEGEGNIGDHRHEGEDDKLTPADALKMIDEIMGNTEHPYWNSHDPRHDDALKEMVDLRIAADPTASTELARAGFGT